MKVMVSISAVHMDHVRKHLRSAKKAKNGKLYDVKTGWDKNGRGIKALRMLMPKSAQKKYRLYMPILESDKPKKIEPLQAVSAAVKEHGYIIEDYIAGIACTPDGKRRRKIGALIASSDPEALKQFVNDDRRSAFKSKHYVVFSAHPYDILGMSTGRRWDRESCMHLPTPENKSVDGGTYRGKLLEDIRQGTIVAYVIDNFDVDEAKIAELEHEWNQGPIQQDKMELLRKLKKQIHDVKNLRAPKGRLLIKPFIDANDPERVMYKVEPTVYGTKVIGFEKAVKRFTDRLNRKLGTYKANGIFHLADDLYDDGVGEKHVRMDFDSVEDKMEFYDANEPLMSDIEWLLEDARWLHTILEHDTKVRRLPRQSIVAKLAGMLGYHTDNAKLLVEIDKFLEKQPREFVEELAYDVVSSRRNRTDNAWKNSLKSKVLSSLMEEDFEFSSEEDARGADDSWIIEYACKYDLRWLIGLTGKVESLHEKHLCIAVYEFLNTPIDMKIIRPILDSDREAVVDILKGLRLLCELVTHIPKNGVTAKPFRMTNDAVKTAERYKKLLASDKYLFVCNERNESLKSHLIDDAICTYLYIRPEKMIPMLLAADADWLFKINGAEHECDMETLNNPAIYERLVSMPKDDERRNQIIAQIVEAYNGEHTVREMHIRRNTRRPDTSFEAASKELTGSFPNVIKIIRMAKKEADGVGLTDFTLEHALKRIA